MADIIKPHTFAHVVYRTYRFDEMLSWYQKVFGARIQHKAPLVAFLTYDEEHHRIAIANLSALPPEARPPMGGPGTGPIDHVAYGYRSLRELCEKYAELKDEGILPVWCVHHGITISMYYEDPDRNRMEFQADCFKTDEEANDFLAGPKFETNPIGVSFDPEDMLRRLRAGEPEESFLPRVTDLPISMPPGM